MITFLNDHLFPVLLFLTFYCLYSSWFTSPISVKNKEVKQSDHFVNELQQMFEKVEENIPDPSEIDINNQAPNQSSFALLLPAKTSKTRRTNQTTVLVNPILVTPVPVKSSPIPSVPENATIKELRNFIREHNLHQIVKQKIGKSVNKCKKQELLEALS